MELSFAQKAVLNIVTIIAWALGILIIIFVLSNGKKMKQETGVSFKTYLTLVGITEIFYVIGAVMILSAMGVNVMRYLSQLRIWKFAHVMSLFDIGTIKVIGTVGWVGFAINRSISFLSPGYLVICGGQRLPSYLYFSAWAEIGLESFITVLIAASLITG